VGSPVPDVVAVAFGASLEAAGEPVGRVASEELDVTCVEDVFDASRLASFSCGPDAERVVTATTPADKATEIQAATSFVSQGGAPFALSMVIPPFAHRATPARHLRSQHRQLESQTGHSAC
jgi:hypothetical protein